MSLPSRVKGSQQTGPLRQLCQQQSSTMHIDIHDIHPLIILPSGTVDGSLRESNIVVYERISPAIHNTCLLPSITWLGPDDLLGITAIRFGIPYNKPSTPALFNRPLAGIFNPHPAFTSHRFVDKFESTPKVHCSAMLDEQEDGKCRGFTLIYSLDLRRIITNLMSPSPTISYHLPLMLT
jgi:hypothetical protein